MEKRKWSDLPPELVLSIADRLPLSDYVRFRAVCSSWTTAIGDFRPMPPFTNFPWLALVPSNIKCQPHFLDGDLHYHLPHIPTSVEFLSHKDGWLVTLTDNIQPDILNPLTGVRLHLPPFRDDYMAGCKISRTILATTPSSPISALTFVIHQLRFHQYLSFARPGDRTWTRLHALHRDQYLDIVYHEDRRFYAVLSSGKLLSFDLMTGHSLPQPNLLAQKKPLPRTTYSDQYCSSLESNASLVSSSGDLLKVTKTRTGNYFVIQKFDPLTDEWVRIMDLGPGRRSLFVDETQVVAFCDDKDKEEEVRRGNCVYYPYGDVVGMFELEKGTVRLCSVPDMLGLCCGSLIINKFWFMPSPF